MTREEVLAQVLGENDEEYSVFDDSESDEAKKATTMRASQEGGGGGMFPCSLEKIRVSPLFPQNKFRCSLNSLLLSSPVPRNSTPCSLDPQKYFLMFPKIPNIFQFFDARLFSLALPRHS